ncbi:cyclic nucleotide-binding domain-containing protein [Nitrospinae bacterium]|nr:cyclic nucleotide-binding domain-containing protein [Nitrospinota bacterium]
METTKTFVKEEIIFQQGERSKYAYIIESGKVGIYKENKYGKKSLIGILKKSDLFGEMGLIDKYPRSATAIAMEKSRLTLVDESRFSFLCEHNPKFIVTLIKTLSSRLRDTLGQLKHQEGKLKV